MSSRNHHLPCHRKPTCCKKGRPTCPTDHCSASKPPCHDPCREEDPCSFSGGGGCSLAVADREPYPQQQNNNNNQSGAGGGSGVAGGSGVGGGGPSPPQKNVEAEVDRLVDCARAWSEKEKFKLKQFYEEEMVRKKRAVIQEFKCAMEREVISPLKTKLCEYEKEIHKLREQLEAAANGQPIPCETQPQTLDTALAGQMNNNKKSMVTVDLDVVDKAIEKARKSNLKLQKVIKGEKIRKSVRTLSEAQLPLTEGIVEEPSKEGEEEELVKQASGGIAATSSPEVTVEDQGGDQDKPVSISKSKESVGGKSIGRKSVGGKSVGGKSARSAAATDGGKEDMAALEVEVPPEVEEEEETEDKLEEILVSAEVTEDTKALVEKVIDLAEAFVNTKNFTEEEIQDLIKEGELAEQLRKEREELREENEELKRRIAELLKRLAELTPEKGSTEEENMMLRQRIQELEGERTRGSLQTELNLLRQQLDDVWEKNEVEKEAQSQLELIPEGEGEVADGGGSIKSTPKSGRSGGAGGEATPKQQSKSPSQPGSKRSSRNQSPGTLSKGASAKTISQKSSGSGGVQEEEVDVEGTKTPGKSIGGKSIGGESSRRSRVGGRSTTPSMRSQALTAKSLGEITGPFEDQIKLLLERIKELEDHLNAMAELEVRLKELEAQTEEMERLRQQLKELTAEVEELRARECPVCPVPSESELKATRQKLEESGRLLQDKIRELQDLSDKLNNVEKANAELKQSVASFKAVEQKHEELQSLHAQVLEEKRRKSLEARELGKQVAQLEADYLQALQDIDKLKGQLKAAEDKAREMEEANRKLEGDLREARRKLEENNNNVDELKRKLKDSEAALEDLRGRNAELEVDNGRMRKKLEEATTERDKFGRELEGLRRHLEEVQENLMKQLKEQQKKCSEACDALSKRGQCILEHEKKCLNVTSQMEKDNQELQDKLRQMQGQLDAMVDMERRTKQLHGEMEAYHRRAQERGRELEELKKLPETCDLQNVEGGGGSTFVSALPSPMFSLPSLPTPSQLDTVAPSTSGGILKNGGSGRGGDGGSGSSGKECKLLSAKLKDWEQEKEDLGRDLEGKKRALEEVNRKLEDAEAKGRRLKEDKDKACKDN